MAIGVDAGEADEAGGGEGGEADGWSVSSGKETGSGEGEHGVAGGEGMAVEGIGAGFGDDAFEAEGSGAGDSDGESEAAEVVPIALNQLGGEGGGGEDDLNDVAGAAEGGGLQACRSGLRMKAGSDGETEDWSAKSQTSKLPLNSRSGIRTGALIDMGRRLEEVEELHEAVHGFEIADEADDG